MQSCVCPHQTITKKQKTKPAHHLFQNISNNTLFKYKLKDLFFYFNIQIFSLQKHDISCMAY